MPALDLAPSALHLLPRESRSGGELVDRPRGCTELAGPGQLRALTTLLLLGPCTPTLFQGQEYGSTRPFHFFADHEPDLADADSRRPRALPRAVRALRRSGDLRDAARPVCARDLRDLEARSRGLAADHRLVATPSGSAPTAARGPGALARRRAVGRGDRRRSPPAAAGGGSGTGLGPIPDGERLIAINLGHDLDLARVTHPFVAPPTGDGWRLLWSSESASTAAPAPPRSSRTAGSRRDTLRSCLRQDPDRRG